MIAGIALIALGIAGILFGLSADQFYPVFIRRPEPDKKTLPKWLGRTVFFIVGLWFIYSGFFRWLHR